MCGRGGEMGAAHIAGGGLPVARHVPCTDAREPTVKAQQQGLPNRATGKRCEHRTRGSPKRKGGGIRSGYETPAA